MQKSLQLNYMMKYLELLKNLNLPPEQFAVFGSGPLAIRGWRENKDIDIIVTSALWNELRKKYTLYNEKSIRIEVIEIFRDWKPWFHDVEELIKTADFFENIRFVNLENVLKWKEAKNRKKDREDIKLIRKHKILETNSR